MILALDVQLSKFQRRYHDLTCRSFMWCWRTFQKRAGSKQAGQVCSECTLRISQGGGWRVKIMFRDQPDASSRSKYTGLLFQGNAWVAGAQEVKYFVWGACSARRPRNFAMFPVRPVIYCWFHGRTSSDLIGVWLYLHERAAHARTRPFLSRRGFTCCLKWFGKYGARAANQSQYKS